MFGGLPGKLPDWPSGKLPGGRPTNLVTKVAATSANAAQQRTMKRTSVDHTPTKGFAMACFVVPAAEGAVVKVIEQKAKKSGENTEACVRRVERLGWLSKMLWGGSALLAFEHVWHGEVVPFFPFLSAMATPADAAAMFGEMATTGVAMAVVVTAAWGGLCAVANAIEQRAAAEQAPALEA